MSARLRPSLVKARIRLTGASKALSRKDRLGILRRARRTCGSTDSPTFGTVAGVPGLFARVPDQDSGDQSVADTHRIALPAETIFHRFADFGRVRLKVTNELRRSAVA